MAARRARPDFCKAWGGADFITSVFVRSTSEVASRSKAAWLIAALVVLVLLPSANFATFSGVPLTGWPEVVGFFLLSTLMVSSSVRRQLTASVEAVGTWSTRVALVLAAVGVAAKLALLVSGQGVGFLACYHALADTSHSRGHGGSRNPVRGCERSYDNPLSREGVTRIDERLDFGSREPNRAAASIDRTNWNLDFLNSSRFNFYSRDTLAPDRRALPFRSSGGAHSPPSAENA